MTECYQKTLLKNGLRIVSESINHVRSVSVGVWIFTGSRHEKKKENGISHLLEHMVFKGTKSRTAYEIATSLESLGGHLNAFTEKEFTCFYAIVLDENLSETIDVLADVVQHATVAEKDLENEKDIVFEEIRNLEDTPEDRVQDLFIQTVFDSHPLGFSTLGTFESIRHICQSDLHRFHDEHYVGNNIIVAAAGNLVHDRLVDLVQDRFQNLGDGELSGQQPPMLGIDPNVRIQAPIAQSHLCIGTQGFGYRDKRKFALIVLDTYLGGGMSSRLFQNLREKRGIAYSVYSFLDFWSDTGLFGVYTGTASQKTDEALELIEKEFTDLLTKGIPLFDLERNQSQLSRNLILTLEDSTSRMNRLAKMEAYTQAFTPIEHVVSHILSVTQEHVQQVAHELFDQRQRFTAIIEPEEESRY
jgi:predicted Zn-dependent peptidase